MLCTGNWGSAVAGGALFLIAPASGSACCGLGLDLGFSDIKRCHLTLASPCLLSVDFCPAVLVLLHLCVHGFWVSMEHRDTSIYPNRDLGGRLLHWPGTVLSYKYGVGAGQWGQCETKTERPQSGRRRMKISEGVEIKRVGGYLIDA